MAIADGDGEAEEALLEEDSHEVSTRVSTSQNEPMSPSLPSWKILLSSLGEDDVSSEINMTDFADTDFVPDRDTGIMIVGFGGVLYLATSVASSKSCIFLSRLLIYYTKINQSDKR